VVEAAGGAWGGKGFDQEEHVATKPSPDTDLQKNANKHHRYIWELHPQNLFAAVAHN